MELRSEAFRQFVKEDLAHENLDEWRREGHKDWWRMTWLPMSMLAALGLLFFLSSNPEATTTLLAIGAAMIGIVPLLVSLLRPGQPIRSITTDASDVSASE